MRRFKVFSLIIHLTGWLLFMAFPLVFINGGADSSDSILILQKPYYWLFGFTYIALFYLNANLLIPRLFLKKRYLNYSIIIVVLLTSVYFLQPFDKLLHTADKYGNRSMQRPGPPPGSFGPPPNGDQFQPPPPPPYGQFRPPANGNGGFNGPRRNHIDTTSLFIFLMIIALSTATKTIQQWQLTEQRAAQAEADRTSAELSFLKAQINPHFLFNTLNNIYTLAITEDENTADSIMKLSNIMRYVTDEVNADLVPLQSEIDCISDYIELQRLRTGKNADIQFAVKGNTDGKTIPPLVMMTFVENVFKHGISKNKPMFVSISITVHDKRINFFCQNQVFTARAENNRTGIGMKNAKQRLAYLYPGKHTLNVSNDGELYTVMLTLES
jgi:two-component system LytT family sensor kinase